MDLNDKTDMAGLAREYVKKLYYKERLEVVNKIVSTVTALWVICFMDKIGIDFLF